MNDAELIHRALRNPDDYVLIVERYQKQLLGFIRSLSQLTQGDAEDIGQRVFLKAYDHLNDFDTKLKLSTWLLRIARNEVIDFWRRKKVRPQEFPLEEGKSVAQSDEQTMAEQLDKKFTSQRVQNVLKLLKSDYREVLYLYYFENKNYDEIADILQCPPGTVAALISRAKRAFAEIAVRTHQSQYFLPSP